MPNVRVGLFQLLDAGRASSWDQMEDRGGVAFDHSQGQTIPIIPRVSQHILEVIFVGDKSAMFWEHQK